MSVMWDPGYSFHSNLYSYKNNSLKCMACLLIIILSHWKYYTGTAVKDKIGQDKQIILTAGIGLNLINNSTNVILYFLYLHKGHAV